MSRHPILETERMIIRPWTFSDEDREFFHFIVSNRIGRKFYPTRMLREEADVALNNIIDVFEETGIKWRVACRKTDGHRLGFTGLAGVNFEAPFTPTVEIGWQFDPAVWGNGYATEAAKELLQHGFEDHQLQEIVAFAIEENIASTAVMKRIGMKHVVNGDFIHPGIPDSHTHLKRHVLYRLSREDWHPNTTG